jgi:hypothetical protein
MNNTFCVSYCTVPIESVLRGQKISCTDESRGCIGDGKQTNNKDRKTTPGLKSLSRTFNDVNYIKLHGKTYHGTSKNVMETISGMFGPNKNKSLTLLASHQA